MRGRRPPLMMYDYESKKQTNDFFIANIIPKKVSSVRSFKLG